MALTVTLTDAEINESRYVQTAAHQKVQQASDYLPVVVDLSSEITLGLAILTAVAADNDLHDAFNGASEKDILTAITSVAFVNPAASVEIKAYAAAATNKRTIPAGLVTYLPMARLYRNYVEGSGVVTLDLGVAL